MISVNLAEQIIIREVRDYGIEHCSLNQAHGRVLREDIRSDRDQPPFHKALMDGIAISFDAWQRGKRHFLIEGTVPAGQPLLKIKSKDNCVKIMTGSVVPTAFDCVIPIEFVSIKNNFAVIANSIRIKSGQNIRFKGSDHLKGQILLKKGLKLLSPQIGIAASVGKTKLQVSRVPRVAIIATGDELVDIHKSIKPFQTRLSNSYALSALLNSSQLALATKFHLPDNQAVLRREIKKILQRFDIIILSGGVSMGEFDYVPKVLNQLGVKQLFHKVAQKPGKPFWFGKTQSGKVVFALPGNPISTLLCAYRYVVPYISLSLGINESGPLKINFKNPVKVNSKLTTFIPVKVKYPHAQVIGFGGSGDFGSLGESDGFVELPPSKSKNLKSSQFNFYPWRIS